MKYLPVTLVVHLIPTDGGDTFTGELTLFVAGTFAELTKLTGANADTGPPISRLALEGYLSRRHNIGFPLGRCLSVSELRLSDHILDGPPDPLTCWLRTFKIIGWLSGLVGILGSTIGLIIGANEFFTGLVLGICTACSVIMLVLYLTLSAELFENLQVPVKRIANSEVLKGG